MSLRREGRLRVLLSEGSSTSAREALTALGLLGHKIEICDPTPYCISRFSRFVARYHRCPGLGADPLGYLQFVMDLLAREHFDVLLPIHEQGYLFAKVQEQLKGRTAIALPSFESYERALSKAEFSRVLSQLNLPQPETELVSDVQQLRDHDRFPIVVKIPIGTASRGVWRVSDRLELEQAIEEIKESSYGEAIVQEFVRGPVEHAQAIFCRGRLLALHAYRQVLRGAGGGPAVKDSVRRPLVRSHLAKIGAFLNWHGALSVDYILDEASELPRYLDCNPRLVEPINALLAGLDLTDLLLRVSLGEEPAEVGESREGVRTHLAIQILLGYGMRGASRLDLARECIRFVSHTGLYTHSCEELTPVRRDWPSVTPVLLTTGTMLGNPSIASRLSRSWGAHLLTSESVRTIRECATISTPTRPTIINNGG